MSKSAIVLAAHNIGLGVARALGKHSIGVIAVYYQKRDMGYVSKYVQERVRAPHPETAEAEFVDLLIDLAKRHGNCVLFPTDDATLVTVSRHRDRLAEHHTVACAPWSTIRQLIDKKYTYELAESLGIPAPRTRVPQNAGQARDYAERAAYPCLVKPCQSHQYFERFRKKLVKVDNATELMTAYQEAAEAGMEVMLQEFIPGEDTDGVNYNSYYCDGAAAVEFTARKVRLSPPESGVPAVVVSADVPEVVEPARKLLEALRFTGYSCTEFKKDSRDGVYKLMEINPRHNRSLRLAIACGINFPLLEYRHLVEDHIPSAVPYRKGFYWIDLAKDVAACGPYWKRGRFSLTRQLGPYLKPHTFATLDLRDPMPFVKRCLDVLGMACGAVADRVRPKRKRRHVLLGADT